MARTRWLRLMAAVVALLVLTAACGGEEAEEAGSTSTEDAAADTESAENPESAEGTEGGDATTGEQSAEDISGTVDVVMFQSYIDDEDYEAFQERYPNVEVNHEFVAPGPGYQNRIRTLAASGDLPDVIGANPSEFIPLVEAGLVQDLTDAFETPTFEGDGAWGASLDPTIMENLQGKIPEGLRTEGQEWGVPFGAIALAVVYNVEIFDELGLSEPETWEEFMSNNQALREADYIPMSLTGELWKDWWPRIILDQTARDVTPEDVATGEVPLDDPRLLEATDIVQQLYAADVFPEGGLFQGVEESQALFVQGRLAQFLTVPENFVQFLVENSPFEVDAYVLPGAKDLEPVRTLGGSGSFVAVNSDSEDLEAAIAVAKYLTSETLFTEVLADHYVVSPTEGWQPGATGSEVMEVFGEAASNGFIGINPGLPPATYATPEELSRLQTELWPALYQGDLTSEEFWQQLGQLYETDGG